MEQLRELSIELGHPSADKLLQEVRRRNIDVTRKQVQELAHGQPGRQVLKKRPAYEGRVTAFEINHRWP